MNECLFRSNMWASVKVGKSQFLGSGLLFSRLRSRNRMHTRPISITDAVVCNIHARTFLPKTDAML